MRVEKLRDFKLYFCWSAVLGVSAHPPCRPSFNLQNEGVCLRYRGTDKLDLIVDVEEGRRPPLAGGGLLAFH